jgi:hypothetical protein
MSTKLLRFADYSRCPLVDAETHHLTHLYERKLAALEELKKSLLHQAFNGEL